MKAEKYTIALLILLLCPLASNANVLSAKAYALQLQTGYNEKQVFLGRTVGERETDVGFERPGYIANLKVNDGENVRKGQILATLDTARLEQNRKVLLAQRKAIVPELNFASKQMERQKKLLAMDYASEQGFDLALSRTESLQAELAKIDADLGRNDVELKKSVLRAHFAAVVLDRYQHQGTFVQSGQRVLRLQQRDIREVHIGIPPSRIANFKKDSCYPVHIQQQIYNACVKQILPRLSENTQTLRVVFELDTEKKIMSGELASLSIDSIQKVAGYSVPTHALVEGRRGTWQVYALKPEQQQAIERYRIVPVAVEVVYSNGESSYVKGRFGEIKNIIAMGVHKYSPGQLVNIISEK